MSLFNGRVLSFFVPGLPAPQGSKRHVGHGVMIESSKHVKPWREAVKWAAIAARDERPRWRFDGPLFDKPVHLWVTFNFTRPKSHFGTGRNSTVLKPSAPHVHSHKPDLSKLIRSTEDAITDAGIWTDDSLVASVHASKIYSTRQGAEITIEASA